MPELQFLTFVRKWDGVIGDFNTTILLILASSESVEILIARAVGGLS